MMFKTTMVYLKAFKAHGAFEMFFRKKNLMFPEMYLESAHTHIGASIQSCRAEQQQRDQSTSLCSETFYLVWEKSAERISLSVCSCFCSC